MEPLSPRDHGEEVAVFRYGLLGQVVSRPLDHGELAAELRRLSEQRVRPPGSDTTRVYCFPSCRHARRITPAHAVRFRSAEDARAYLGERRLSGAEGRGRTAPWPIL